MAGDHIIKFIGQLFTKLKSFFFSKEALSFVVFLLISSIFWFINALDKEREAEIRLAVHFEGIPQQIALKNNYKPEIVLKVKDQGINLLSYSRQSVSELTFDVRQTFYEKGKIQISADQIRGKLSRQLLPSTALLEIWPDSITVDYEKLASAVIPIEFNGLITTAQQYSIIDDIVLNPKEITVFATAHTLSKLKTIQTEYIELKNINDTVIQTVKLQPIKNVRFSTSDTQMSVFVEMFTEKEMQLPITVVNQPKDIVIRTFPAIVNVKFNVGLSSFSHIKDSDLMAVFDYNEIQDGSNKQKIKIINNKTSKITNIRFTPNEVEYLIENK